MKISVTKVKVCRNIKGFFAEKMEFWFVGASFFVSCELQA